MHIDDLCLICVWLSVKRFNVNGRNVWDYLLSLFTYRERPFTVSLFTYTERPLTVECTDSLGCISMYNTRHSWSAAIYHLEAFFLGDFLLSQIEHTSKALQFKSNNKSRMSVTGNSVLVQLQSTWLLVFNIKHMCYLKDRLQNTILNNIYGHFGFNK